MIILLDTQIFLWMQVEPNRLGRLSPVLADESNQLLLSAASSWEIAIKHSLGRLDLPEPPTFYVPRRMELSGVDGLAIEHAHALAVDRLPLLHRDPFDRLLIAQALTEDATVASADPAFLGYGIELIGT